MFDNKENRYITKGVSEQVSKEIQLYCWQFIDKKNYFSLIIIPIQEME
ncbi:DUF960 family protein [Candidatus Enterococcus mansonii]|nr:DUF960 family protein [Enterococcus sp. 4G2_DIV0659]